MSKLPKISTLEKKLDNIFSKFIRLRDSDKNGFLNCISCDKRLYWKDAHNCHFVRRGKRATRWNESNCYAGCTHCNTFNEGMHYYEMAKKINEYHGENYTEELIRLGHTTFKPDRQWLKDRIDHYTNLVILLEK